MILLIVIKVMSGAGLQSALESSLAEMRRRLNGFGGLIGVDRRGDAAIAFTTERMPWVVAKEGEEVKWGIEPGQLEAMPCWQ